MVSTKLVIVSKFRTTFVFLMITICVMLRVNFVFFKLYYLISAKIRVVVIEKLPTRFFIFSHRQFVIHRHVSQAFNFNDFFDDTSCCKWFSTSNQNLCIRALIKYKLYKFAKVSVALRMSPFDKLVNVL